MSEEEKQLLLIDLCGRLPYGVKINVDGEEDILLELCVSSGWVNASYDVEDVKPYLRSIHKLTKEELEELEFLTDSDYVDYCNEHHIDYRNLIPKGLALEAKEGMYNTK